MEYQILLIEDDPQIREVITDYLSAVREPSFTVDQAATGDLGVEKLYEKPYDCVLLDIMLPGTDGFAVCRQLRLLSDAPVIFLTARGREEDKLKGYSLGCDDYVVKPFSLPVLHAKLKALINRDKGTVREAALKAGAVTLEPDRYQVTLEGEAVELSFKEYALLKYLLEHKNRLCRREELLWQIWGYDFEGNERTVDNHVKKLRKKLREDGTMIRTIFKQGYMLVERGDRNNNL